MARIFLQGRMRTIFLWLKKVILRVVKKIFVKQKSLVLPQKLKDKADWKFKKLLTKFKQEHQRAPSNDELFRIIINASHITIRQKGNKGHWGRQKIRKYLLEKHNVIKNYTMR